jgi:hypothetical protein
MVGFSLGHGPGAILFFFPLLLLVWVVVVVVVTVRSRIRNGRFPRGTWVALAVAISLLAALSLPDGFWQRIFIKRMAASPHAGDLLLYAAYRGDLGTVRELVSHGVPIDAAGHTDWRTAMHGAAGKGDLPILHYLVSQGANINALDRSGDSPTELAAEANHAEAVQFLAENGGKRTRGDEAQHQKAIDDQVREEIERMNSDSKRLYDKEDLEKSEREK